MPPMLPMTHFRFVLSMLRREFRSGELRLLCAALVVAVAALSMVGFFTDRVSLALEHESHQLLGADLLLVADHPWPKEFSDSVRSHGLALAQTETLRSMLMVGEGDAAQARLVEIKAVSTGYPLRGGLRIAPAINAPDVPAPGIPAPGEAWIEARLAQMLNLRVGDTVALGQKTLAITAILTLEPDRGVNFFNVAPRLMMNLADIPATGLERPGSRIDYRLLVAGAPGAVATFRGEIAPRLGRGERIEDADSARPEVRSALERARKFLGLAALLAVILAAVAVALAARRYLQRHLDSCAVMRCLGATERWLFKTHVLQFALLAALASLVGCALGYAAHFALLFWLGRFLAVDLPQPSLLPALQGVCAGMLLLFGFALPPLARLRRVPPLRVLRRELEPADAVFLGGYAFGLMALVALMFWIAGEIRLGAYVAGGFAAALALFALLARGAVRLMLFVSNSARNFSRNVGQNSGQNSGQRFGWHYGLANLERHASASVAQIVALALGFMAILLLTATRGELLTAWQRSLPPETPNRFVLNIQPQAKDEVTAFFRHANMGPEMAPKMTPETTPEMAPMVRGRLAKINGREIRAAEFSEERTQRLVEREFNLSWRAGDVPPPGNRMTAGRWFTAADSGKNLASVEEGLAKTLGLSVGDHLEFSVAGETLSLEIAGLRKLDWDSMRVNFFVLTPPGVLESYPTSYITSFYLPPGRSGFSDRLVHAFPDLTVIDVDAVLQQARTVMDQVTHAVQFVFLFALAAGVIVLYASLLLVFDEKRHELAIMRALGARRAQLRRSLLAEFAAIGAVAGLIAALGADVVGIVLGREVFQLDARFNPLLPPLAALGGGLLAMLAGAGAIARLLRRPPLETLRAEQ